ncbi:polysaccharide deacetylase family protein [Oceanicoccus sagamiensis]|uniref:NodB homology domain-containing protein n=1 Tax=Oceanicoccus sagamiensis TaxID=716816 RepID=A0A1X9NHY2_9GAMM|nr:polysaccharide deacetylase family protein [Oceanicoccus sagamiensis]ARN76002.1 hypothetical protein BST96_19025 [Oceanicoccus sagamiensis]
MHKHLLLSLVVWLSCGLLSQASYAEDVLPNHAVVMLYHHVADNTPAITSISPENFQQQLSYLADNDFHVWPLEKIVKHLQADQTMPDKVVAITFDDSYQSVYDTAYPLLKKRQWPFTIFVSTDAVDGNFNRQTSWEQLRTMARNGATIANHSATHRHLLHPIKPQESKQQWLQRVEKDINRAQQRIQTEIGHSPKLFAYPYGEYNPALAKLLKQMGYIAFGQQSGAIGSHSDFTALPRYPFSGNYSSLDDFALKAMTLPFPVKGLIAPINPLSHHQQQPTLKLKLAEDVLFQQSLGNLQCFASYQGKINTQLQEALTLVVGANKAIPAGRSRYNCTSSISHQGQQRFYWYSHAWIRLDKNNQWILD